jgi:hypothetical protein
VRSWLRHYAASQEVAGSILDEVIGFFNLTNPSGRIMTQELTQQWVSRIFMGSKERLARKTDNLIAICESIVYKKWDSRHLPYGPPRPVTRIILLYFYF